MALQPPSQCTVLVIGGGPAGSYCASALAREGIETVLLEAEKFPRYHVGESMLPTIRHYLRFIGCDEKFDAHGFAIKRGALFKLNSKPPGCLFLVTRKGDIAYTDRSTDTDFITRGGPNNYAYNVIRSEADELLFRHAAESGAHTFDGFKVTSVNFTPSPYLQNADPEFKTSNAGLPESVNWTSKTGISGITTCKYLVDASGRHGLLSTKYLRNRRMNSGSHLQSVATWAYWTNGGVYAQGTEREGYPYFEALVDGSGWVWFIPLHNGQWSVGVVRNRNVLAEKKGEGGGDRAVYLDALHGNPGINELLCRAEMVSEIRSASDWSYSAESYASPYIRIVGDAGCFVDPFFSSGVHLALNSGLSAATTICASIKGQVPEGAAARWHSKRVEESYTRFLVVVSSALKQIIEQESAVLVEEDEKSFEKAFQQFRPVIQGSADFDAAHSGVSAQRAEVIRTINFCISVLASSPTKTQSTEAQQKLLSDNIRLLTSSKPGDLSNEKYEEAINKIEASILKPEQIAMLDKLRGEKRLVPDDIMNIDSAGLDVLDGLSANLVRGQLGLVGRGSLTEVGREQVV